MRGRYRPCYFADDYAEEVVAKGKCDIFGPSPTYRPLLTVSRFSSKGFRCAVPSWRTRRAVHLMSRHEAALFYYLHIARENVGIFEQVALDPAHTRDIARALGFKHPAVHGRDVVMSTDFVVRRETQGSTEFRAFSVKQQDDLSARTFQKLSIEQRYWEERGCQWKLALDTKIPTTASKNMALVFSSYERADLPCSLSELGLIRNLLEEHYTNGGFSRLTDHTSECDRYFGLSAGASLTATYHFVVTGTWPIDWHRPILPSLDLLLPPNRQFLEISPEAPV